MIPDLNEFVQKYKLVTTSHRDVYMEKSPKLIPWSDTDFNAKNILLSIDSNDSVINNGVLKKAYDTIKTYHRTFKVYSKSREDYYRSSVIDRGIDNLVMDTISSNLNKVNSDIENSQGFLRGPQ